jgi:hypothetical protein
MHFDFTVSFGNIVTLCLVGIGLFRMDRLAAKFLVEHEILIADYCKRLGIEVKDMPTRMKSILRG